MKRQEDLLNLKWRDFKENATSAFRALREEQEFADVTLVCEDGQHVEAHKAILASSSPLFLNLLKDNQNPHPFIFMTDLKYETVLAMVDFLYNGETNVDEEEVKLFLAAAEELKVKGLANLDAQFKSQKNSNKKKHKITYFKDELDEILFDFDEKTNVNTKKDIRKPTQKKKQTKKYFKKEVLLEAKIQKSESIDEEIEKEIEKEINLKSTNLHKRILSCHICKKEFTSKKCFENHVIIHEVDEKTFKCDLCKSTFSTKKYFKQHVKSHHARSCECRNINDLDERNILYHNKTVHLNQFGCNICLKTFKSKSKSIAHMWDHNGSSMVSSNFQCDNCGKEYKLSRDLNVHKKFCLDQKPTKCDLCEKVFKGEFRMQIHKKRSHKDLHPCPECSTQVKNLSKHMLRVHINEKRFPCSQCDKGFIEGDKLRDHIRSVHDKEKPYECRYDCGVRVSSPAYRRKHEKQKHGQAWEGVEREGGLLGTANTFL